MGSSASHSKAPNHTAGANKHELKTCLLLYLLFLKRWLIKLTKLIYKKVGRFCEAFVSYFFIQFV